MCVSQIAGVTSVPAGRLQAVDVQIGCKAPSGERDDRAQAQRLGDHGAQVAILVTRIHLGRQTCERRRVAQQQIERPGERRGGRLVAGEQQRDQLVAHLAVAHLAPVLEAGGDEQREDVLALGAGGIRLMIGTTLGDLRQQQLVDLSDQLAQARQRIATAKAAREQHSELQGWRGRFAQQRRQPLAQAARRAPGR